MIRSLNIRTLTWRANKRVVLLYLAYTAIAGIALRHYINWQSLHVVLGIIAMPVVTTLHRNHKQSLRFAWVALLSAALCLWLPVKTLLFLSVLFACFFVTETCLGKMNLLPVLVAGIISPVFQHASNVMSFPLRLWLTKIAGSMMNTTVAGNMIYYNGNEFSVDPACMGLNMLMVSLLLQLMLIAVFQKQAELRINRWVVLLLLGFSMVMNVVSNLFRIVCLVFFNVLPGTFMHDVVGIICLLVYVVLPMVYATKWLLRRTGKPRTVESGGVVRGAKFIHAVLLIIISFSTFAVCKNEKITNDITAPVTAVPGFEVRRVDADIVKLMNAQSLVYIKHIRGFYRADHHPAICWKGSGYEFKQIQQQRVDGQLIYTAVMENGKDKLYTAWWYDNGSIRTIRQTTWRWEVLNGGNEFSLINVTTNNQQQLLQQVRQLFQKRIL